MQYPSFVRTLADMKMYITIREAREVSSVALTVVSFVEKSL
jgi:hypothetical protein